MNKMIKKFLLIFVAFFTPMVCFGDVEIGSPDTLIQRWLALNRQILISEYKKVVAKDCFCTKYATKDADIEKMFLNSNPIIPFSAKDLLEFCIDNITLYSDPYLDSEEYYDSGEVYCGEDECKDRCANFTYSYINETLKYVRSKEFFSEKCDDIINKGRVDLKTYGGSKDKWILNVPGGKIRGDAACSSTEGIYGQVGDPNMVGRTKYCWCRVTKSVNACPFSSSWVYRGDYDSALECVDYCALDCVESIRGDAGFRKAIFVGDIDFLNQK